MNLAHGLADAARFSPGRTGIFVGTREWKRFRPLAADVARLAGSLRETLALAPGERVALVMKNGPHYAEILLATWWAGLAVVPVNAKLHPSEVGWILAHCGARVVFVTPDWSGAIGEALAGNPVPPRVIEAGSAPYEKLYSGPERAPHDDPDALAWIFYTSGTTGRPKGAMLTHANLHAMARGYFADVDAIDPADCIIHAAPMSHGSGLYLVPHLLAGAAQVIPESAGFDAAEVFALARAHRGATLFAAPTMVKRLVDHAEATGCGSEGIKTIVYGGGPMYVADIRRALAVMGPRFAQIYGQGESPMTITAATKAVIADSSQPRYLERLASVGRAQRAVEVRVNDGDGRVLPAGEVGEVGVRGPTVMKGYWNDPDASGKALRGGWLWTGDLGNFDDEGFLTLRDRSKDLIISGGSNIYPREVEEVLLGHPAVAEVSVVGAPDPEWGEVVVAFVVARGAYPDVAELDRHCLAHIARFKRPKIYRFVEELPKNSYGKVLKTALREALQGSWPENRGDSV